MKLKCFGGPNDGNYEYIRGDLKQGDGWQIREYPKEVIMEWNIPPDGIPDAIVAKIHIYIVETLTSPKGKWKFLRYEKDTIEEIFDKIFT